MPLTTDHPLVVQTGTRVVLLDPDITPPREHDPSRSARSHVVAGLRRTRRILIVAIAVGVIVGAGGMLLSRTLPDPWWWVGAVVSAVIGLGLPARAFSGGWAERAVSERSHAVDGVDELLEGVHDRIDGRTLWRILDALPELDALADAAIAKQEAAVDGERGALAEAIAAQERLASRLAEVERLAHGVGVRLLDRDVYAWHASGEALGELSTERAPGV